MSRNGAADAAEQMRGFVIVLRRALASFRQDRCTSFAAAISYFALFSIFPMLLCVLSALGFFVHSAGQREAMIDALVALLGPAVGRSTIVAQVDALAQRRGEVGVAGLVVAIWSASAVFGAIRTGLNAAWDVAKAGPIVTLKLRDIASAVAIGCLMLASIALTGFLTAIEGIGARLLGHPIGPVIHAVSAVSAVVLPPVISFVAFGLVYCLIPQAKIHLRDVWFGALVAAILFQIAQIAFGVYVGHFAHYQRLYGPVGAVIAFLVFVYISANILLLGGEVTREHADQRLRAPPTEQRDLPALAPRLPSRVFDALKGLFVSR